MARVRALHGGWYLGARGAVYIESSRTAPLCAAAEIATSTVEVYGFRWVVLRCLGLGVLVLIFNTRLPGCRGYGTVHSTIAIQPGAQVSASALVLRLCQHMRKQRAARAAARKAPDALERKTVALDGDHVQRARAVGLWLGLGLG